jgi:hypothetical protein
VTVLRELSRHGVDLVGVQRVRWQGSGTVPAGQYAFSNGEGNKNHELGTWSFVHKRTISAVKRIESVSDRMPQNIERPIVSCYCTECSCQQRIKFMM